MGAPTTPARRVLVVQHQDDCGPGWVGEWLVEEDCTLRLWAADREPEVPGLDDVEGLLVLGGYPGAHDDDTAPWLPAVRDLIAEAARRGLPALGICLGHQLAAVALGGASQRNPAGQRVGVTPIGWTDRAAADPLAAAVLADGAVPARGVHWNSDVVVVEPEGTVALARTDDGALQMARFAPTVWGVQMHPEVDHAGVCAWAARYAVEHAERGLDQRAVLDEVAAARDELRSTWVRLVRAFAALLTPASEPDRAPAAR